MVSFPSGYGALYENELGIFKKFEQGHTITSGALHFRNPPLSHTCHSARCHLPILRPQCRQLGFHLCLCRTENLINMVNMYIST